MIMTRGTAHIHVGATLMFFLLVFFLNPYPPKKLENLGEPHFLMMEKMYSNQHE
jgi:hypothetical protein